MANQDRRQRTGRSGGRSGQASTSLRCRRALPGTMPRAMDFPVTNRVPAASIVEQVAPTCHHACSDDHRCDRDDASQRDAQRRGSGRPTLRAGLVEQIAPTCHHDRGDDTQREARQTRTGTERCRRPRPANDACPNWLSQLAPDWRPTCLPVPIGALNCSAAASVAWGNRSGLAYFWHVSVHVPVCVSRSAGVPVCVVGLRPVLVRNAKRVRRGSSASRQQCESATVGATLPARVLAASRAGLFDPDFPHYLGGMRTDTQRGSLRRCQHS